MPQLTIASNPGRRSKRRGRRSRRYGRNTGTVGPKNFLANLSSSFGTFVGRSSKRRKSRRSKRRGGRCTTSRQCRSAFGTFATGCAKGVKRWAVTHCRNRKGQFVRKSR